MKEYGKLVQLNQENMQKVISKTDKEKSKDSKNNFKLKLFKPISQREIKNLKKILKEDKQALWKFMQQKET